MCVIREEKLVDKLELRRIEYVMSLIEFIKLSNDKVNSTYTENMVKNNMNMLDLTKEEEMLVNEELEMVRKVEEDIRYLLSR